MDLEYFYNQLREEIDGARDYIKKAIELKAMSSSMSKKFYEMAVEEHKHATNIYEMSMTYCNKISEAYGSDIPDYIKSFKDKITNVYSKEIVDIKILISMYKD